MNRLILALSAAATLAAGAGAAAQAQAQDAYGRDWNPPSYAGFWPQYQHICDEITEGRREGAFSPRDAGYFYRALQDIRYRAMWEKDRGLYDGGEIDARFRELDQRMDAVRDGARERVAYDRYNFRPYGDYRPRW